MEMRGFLQLTRMAPDLKAGRTADLWTSPFHMFGQGTTKTTGSRAGHKRCWIYTQASKLATHTVLSWVSSLCVIDCFLYTARIHLSLCWLTGSHSLEGLYEDLLPHSQLGCPCNGVSPYLCSGQGGLHTLLLDTALQVTSFWRRSSAGPCILTGYSQGDHRSRPCMSHLPR